ncbi:MAG TPA: hypothetical protein VFL91_21570 [Thermomicrobiales bacterium]|nr:hypothetical protein [Thermomicrobiales bacterium]
MSVHLQVSKGVLPAFLACLGIGTLHAIRTGAVPAEAGIWTLAPPRFLLPIRDRSLAPEAVIEVFRVCDELDAIQEVLGPDEFDKAATDLIERLQAVLARVYPNWGMGVSWLEDSDEDVPHRGWAISPVREERKDG